MSEELEAAELLKRIKLGHNYHSATVDASPSQHLPTAAAPTATSTGTISTTTSTSAATLTKEKGKLQQLADTITIHTLRFREAISDDDTFYDLLDIIGKFTDNVITVDEYQKSIKNMVPSQLRGKYNSLIKSVIDYVEAEIDAEEDLYHKTSKCNISDDIKLPSMSEMLKQLPMPYFPIQNVKEQPHFTYPLSFNETQVLMQKEAQYIQQQEEEYRPVPEVLSPAQSDSSPMMNPQVSDKEETEDSDSETQDGSKSKKKKSRVRNEWTTAEDKIFLEGLKQHGLDFAAIAVMLPSRSRYQIRTHYAYLAKSLRANEKGNQSGEGIVRRLKTRGRPPKGSPNAAPNELLSQITEVISQIENKDKKYRSI